MQLQLSWILGKRAQKRAPEGALCAICPGNATRYSGWRSREDRKREEHEVPEGQQCYGRHDAKHEPHSACVLIGIPVDPSSGINGPPKAAEGSNGETVTASMTNTG